MGNVIFDRIKKDLEENDVVLYMKGTPIFPQCGFSAAVVQIPEKSLAERRRGRYDYIN